ncbi:tumor necrosis factor receptor superfamily member 9 [Eptesicus fuscus]|uniref:tumor necrosis factor receptor superfamily member 9 n=1 Tax=Eptesicus fuscus TaxID=29078 RepID=UPI002404184F|nr:tumor necrosis factor receptor superfamily member 9 [Eptesicus fuscus]
MGRGRYHLVAALLLALSVERVRSGQGSCRDCPAGTFCAKTETPTCARCPPNSFSRTPGQEACRLCRRCEGVFRTKKRCSPTSDAECECVPGFHCRGAACAMCEPDCGRGQGLTADGCKDCDSGTFNDQKLGTCRPWTDCARDGKAVLANGTTERDVVCGPPSADPSPDAPPRPRAHRARPRPPISILLLALAAAAALALLLLLALRSSEAQQGRRKLLSLLKQPFLKPVRTAQEEDGCSCGFPEEEEGEEGQL